MATREFKWRTAPSGVEGTSTVYADANFGSDDFGDGTRGNPYKTLTKSYNAKSTKPTTIICRGTFREKLSNGNHSCAINGDYMGAAVYDGENVNIIYGFGHKNMIFKNVRPGDSSDVVQSGAPVPGGVGRAIAATHVGYANLVFGVAGSSVSMHKSALYFGYIGGNTAVSNCVYDSPVHNANYYLSLGGNQNERFLEKCTVYNVAVKDRVKCQYGNTVDKTIFGKFAFIGNELRRITFTYCIFASDCHWYWFNGTKGTDEAGYEEIILTGETSSERIQNLLNALTTKGLASNLMPVFTECTFSDQSSDQIFNAPDDGDFTLIPGCVADWSLIGENEYCGALPPAKRIRVMSDSTGVPETWDENSASGCIEVSDNAIMLNTESLSLIGEILSKIIHIDPETTQYNYIQNIVESKFNGLRTILNDENYMGDTYQAGDTLPIGRYIVYGQSAIYDGNTFTDGNIIKVTAEETTFASDNSAVLIQVVEPNIMDVVYVRSTPVVSARVGVNDNLQRGATYLNDGDTNITYRNRTIVPGESFVCLLDDEHFSCDDTSYEIAVMFDDTRVPASEWIPAQQYGEYFVSKRGGAIQVDEYGIPYSSGNYMSYQGAALLKTILSQRYIQLAYRVKRYGTGIVS